MRLKILFTTIALLLTLNLISCPNPAGGNQTNVVPPPPVVKNFTVTVSSNDQATGSVAISPNGTSHADGSVITISATPASGYQFTGWSGDATGIDNPKQITVIKDLIIRADFAAIPGATTHQVNFTVSPAGAGTINKTSNLYTEGTVLSNIQATAASHAYVFSHWEIDSVINNNPSTTFTVGQADSEIIAVFDAVAPVTPTIIFDPVNSGTAAFTPASGPYYPGDTIQVTITPDSSHDFATWSGDLSGTDGTGKTWLLDANPTATATMSPCKTLTISAIGTSATLSATPAGGSYHRGTMVDISAPEVPGYVFDGWKENGAWTGLPQKNTISIQMNQDRTLVAQYTANTSTIMVYMDADNNLEPNAIQDLNEMEAADLRGTGINVVVLFDRIAGYDSSNGDWTTTRAYRISYSGTTLPDTTIISPRVACPSLGITATNSVELDLGSPSTLTAFVNWGKSAYPASQTTLIFWDHGNGWRQAAQTAKTTWTPGSTSSTSRSLQTTQVKAPSSQDTIVKAVCIDDTSSSALYTKMLGTALADNSLSVIGFDLCKAGMIEVAYEIRNKASFMIASEENTPADGWEYQIWLANFAAKSNRSNLELVNSVVDSFAQTYSSNTGSTLAGYDLSKVDDLMTALNSFSSALSAYITSASTQANVGSLFYNYVEDFYTVPGDINLDIWHMADRVYTVGYITTPALNLRTAVNTLVVKEWHNTTTGSAGNANAHGIAIHFGCLNSTPAPNPGSENIAYFANHAILSPSVGNVPSFVDAAGNAWVPNFTDYTIGSGLLYKIWYRNYP